MSNFQDELEDMDLDKLFKEIPSNTVDIPPMNVADVPPKDATTPQKKTTTVPSTSSAPSNFVTTSTSMGTTATTTMSLNTSSHATCKLHNNIHYIICYLLHYELPNKIYILFYEKHMSYKGMCPSLSLILFNIL